jgi:hypothetical protein
VICELAEAKTIEERDAVMDRAIAAEKAAGDIAQAEVNWLRLGWELPRAW